MPDLSKNHTGLAAAPTTATVGRLGERPSILSLTHSKEAGILVL
jgi:hypothetical protein